MKFLGMAVKAALSLAAAIYLISDGVLLAIAWFAIIYALLSYYMWYFKKKEFSFSVWIGSKGLLMTFLSLLFAILSPIIPLGIIIILLNKVFPDGIGQTICSIVLIILCFGVVAKDIITVIQHFNSSFSVPFLQKKDGNGDLK